MTYLKGLRKLSRGDATNKILTASATVLVIFSFSLLIDFDREKDFTADSIRVIDGDTVEASVNSSDVTVRLLGVDTPETQMENNPSEYGLEDNQDVRRCLDNWGAKATEYAERFITSDTAIRTDRLSSNYGDYNRLLAYVENSNGSLNRELVRKGYGRVYESEFTELENYLELEEQAREQRRGLWNC